MDTSHNDLLGELAADAALERADFLVQATEQFRRFLDRHGARIRDIGGLTLIDEDPDYLSIAPDLTFRSRSRYQDGETGEWVSETEVVETAGELIELYNPADLYAAFAEAAREAAGLEAEPTATGDLFETAHVSPTDSISLEDPYAGAADSWAAGQIDSTPPSSEEEAAHRLYDLALAFQDRSQRTEAGLFEQFSEAAEPISAVLGDVTIVDDEDERLTLGRGGSFRGEVIPDDESGEWRTLATADDLVEFYDPTDVFGDLADALAEAFPAIAPDARDGDPDDDADADEAEDAGVDAKAGAAGVDAKAGAAGVDAKAGAADTSASGSVDRG
ncbi:MAG: hypothetical protein IVW53_11950 [Chloroflexi bacterium]|nr:hypothetical protein [Chloroflexota bacterium]